MPRIYVCGENRMGELFVVVISKVVRGSFSERGPSMLRPKGSKRVSQGSRGGHLGDSSTDRGGAGVKA